MIVKNQIKICEEPSCMKKFIFLLNPRTKAMVPVDYDSLTSDEVKLIELAPKKRSEFKADVVLCFNEQHHVSHFKTCKKPNLFSSKKGNKNE